MDKQTITKPLEKAVSRIKFNSPTILTCVGISGMLIGAGYSCKATIKAERILKGMPEDATRVEKLKKIAPVYIPPAIIFVTASACIFGGNHINLKRNAALGMAYEISKDVYSDYREKTKETVGEEKEQEIRDAIARKHLEQNPVDEGIAASKTGEVLCYDAVSGRYFRNSIEGIRSIINDLNAKIIREDYIDLNELYMELNLDPTEIGDMLGWHVDLGLIEPAFSTQIASNGEPCLVLNYNINPGHGYSGEYRY